jgi:hypothetical protein
MVWIGYILLIVGLIALAAFLRSPASFYLLAPIALFGIGYEVISMFKRAHEDNKEKGSIRWIGGMLIVFLVLGIMVFNTAR